MNIELTRGRIAIVDDIDGDLGQLNWQASPEGSKSRPLWYAKRFSSRATGKRGIRMHRVILERMLGRTLVRGEQVDHIDHNGLNNRRSNLRLATSSENHWNQRSFGRPKHSVYRGVTWHKGAKKWRARINIDGKQIHLGYYDDQVIAGKAFDNALREFSPEFGAFNFPCEVFECRITEK